MNAARTSTTYEAFAQRVGTVIGASAWQVVDQPMIDRFADLTGDDGFPHVDPVRAAATPYGGTIAHGLLLVALVGGMARQILPDLSDRQYLVAYGWEKIRFTSPVKSGARVRGHMKLQSALERSQAERLLRFAVTIEVEGSGKPAMVGELLQMVVLKTA